MSRYELPDGSWDMEREAADCEMADLEAAGAAHGRRMRRVRAALAVGDPVKAAELCDHRGSSGGAPDGRGRVCCECGSRIDEGWPPRTLEAGAFPDQVYKIRG